MRRMDPNSQQVDLSALCRVCLEEAERMYPLIGPIVNVDVELATMIAYCTGEEIELSEDLPNSVCLSCFQTVRIAYNFIMEFKDMNRHLLNLRESNKMKQEELEEPGSDNDVVINEVETSFFKEEKSEVKELYEDVIKSDMDAVIDEEFKDLSNETKIEEIKIETEPEIPESQSSTGIKKTVGKSYQCPICWKIVSRFNAVFLPHLYSHKDEQFICNLCELDSKLTLEDYVQHFKKIHLYQCPVCNKSLNNKSTYNYHTTAHKEKKQYVCSYGDCKRTFTHSWRMKKHFIAHTDTTGYICSKCGKKCNTYDTLRYHLKTHDGKRNYLCTECGQRFFQSVHLKAHMWKHTGIKQFRCSKCSKSYTCVTQLKKHLRKYCGSEETQNIKQNK